MAPVKHRATSEPFLNTVARKIGQAAGTFTKVTQQLTENLSTLPAKARKTTKKAKAKAKIKIRTRATANVAAKSASQKRAGRSTPAAGRTVASRERKRTGKIVNRKPQRTGSTQSSGRRKKP